MNDTIEEFMKENDGFRLSNGTRWMVNGDFLSSDWIVYEQRYGQRVKEIKRTDELQLALLSLRGEEE